MKVLVLRGNPRKDGYTQWLTDQFVGGARETGEVTDVDLTTCDIEHCLGCYSCWLVTPGRCVHDDDMSGLLATWAASDVIVVATPVYHYAMSSWLKKCFERTFPLSQPGSERTARGLLRNRLHDPDGPMRRLIAIATGALKQPANFAPMVDTFALIADGMCLELGGVLMRAESHMLQFAIGKPRTFAAVRGAFVEAGRQAGRKGAVDAETLATAALPIAGDLDHFETYSNIYWEHAVSVGAAARRPSVLCDTVGRDVRILLREMVRSFDAVVARSVRARLVFDFSDPDHRFRVLLADGTCRLVEDDGDGDLRVSCSCATWADLVQQRVDPRILLQSGALRLAGDKALFHRLPRWFPMTRD